MKNTKTDQYLKIYNIIEKDAIDYIIRYCKGFMTELELKALKHIDVQYSLDLNFKEDLVGRSEREAHFYKRGWLTKNEDALELLKEGRDIFRKKVATRITIEDLNGEVYNLCPKCNKLVRTPMAKQCQHCFYTWH